MDTHARKMFHEACVRLRDDASLRKPHGGICTSLIQILPPELVEDMNVLAEVSQLASGWEKWSGKPYMPVPAVNGRGYRAHSVAGAMWEGGYGALRLELLDHLIAMTA